MIFEYIKKHASEEVKYYALYGFFFLGIKKSQLAKIYHKDITTITRWIDRYEESDSVSRKSNTRTPRKFDRPKIDWLLELYDKNPILYLDEAKAKFQSKFGVSISASYICKILHDNNLSWKTLEVRAMQIKSSEIERFFYELQAIDWCYLNLVFLDEVSMDNKGIMRRKGYGIIGKKLIYRGEYVRRPRVSFLCFLGESGILDTYKTDGTFTRLKFLDCCKEFALGGPCKTYPGKSSVWILDGARLHCHPSIIRYLRSIGIIPIFLPAYSPFFNPIETIFGIVKSHLKRRCADLELKVNEEFVRMRNFPCADIFKKCGYVYSGKFDPSVGYKQDYNKKFDAVIDKIPFWKKKGDYMTINKNSDWYIELQADIHITRRKYGYMMIWLGDFEGEPQYRVVEVPRDNDFFEKEIKPKLDYFYNEVMLKELVDPRKGRKGRNMKLRVYDAATQLFV